ncbi:hypothetical protein [Pseudoduganella aquatica]|uniref:hypothetical protein n=1 Tax=Pseudoduganella aquatica TaxID=2660641 RepID=UPI001E4AA522|nr:hypothetical protein [Pseudoduganella aquatica]
MSDQEQKSGSHAADEPLTPEQTAALARVERLEAEIAPPAVGEDGLPLPEPESPMDAAAENVAILGLLVGMLTPAAPFLAECYPPAVVERIGLAYTAVEQKHGWNARALLSVEAQLAIVALPPTIMAVMMGRDYFRQRAIENKLPFWLKWFRRKKEPIKPLGGDSEQQEA